MCKGTCQKRCDNEGVGIKCIADRHPMGLDYYPCTAVKIPAGKASMEVLTDKGWEQIGTVEGFQPFVKFERGAPGLEIKGFQVSGTIQLEEKTDMARACEIGSRLGKQIVAEGMGDEMFDRLMGAVRKDNAEYQLLKLVEAVGLRNWFDGDFVVLSYDQAEKLSNACDEAGIHAGWTVGLDDAIERAEKR